MKRKVKRKVLGVLLVGLMSASIVGCGDKEQNKASVLGEGDPKETAVVESEETKISETKEDTKEDTKEETSVATKGPYDDLSKAIEGQVFEVNFDSCGDATFAPFWDEDHDLVVTLRNDLGIFYEQTLSMGWFENVTEMTLEAVSFEDVDLDGLNDIVLIAKKITYWEYSDQTSEGNLVFLLVQDMDKNTFVYDKAYSEAMERLDFSENIEDIREGVQYFQDTAYEKVDILTNDQIQALSYDEKMQAFLEGKIQVDYTTENGTSKNTLHDLMKIYQEEYLGHCEFEGIKPLVSSGKLKAQTKEFFLVGLYCNLALEETIDYYLLSDCGDHLEIIYTDSEWSRRGVSFFEGILVSSSGSGGASYHGGELKAIGDDGKVITIYEWTETTVREWDWNVDYYYGVDWDISDMVSTDFYDNFLSEYYVFGETIGDKNYWVLEAWDEDYSYQGSEQDYLEAAEAIKKSNVSSKVTFVTYDELEIIEKEYAKSLGFTLE